MTGEGDSPAPLTDRLIALDSAYNRRYALTIDWRDLDGYFRRFERTRSTVNLATFVGATQVRRAVIGAFSRVRGELWLTSDCGGAGRCGPARRSKGYV